MKDLARKAQVDAKQLSKQTAEINRQAAQISEQAAQTSEQATQISEQAAQISEQATQISFLIAQLDVRDQYIDHLQGQQDSLIERIKALEEAAARTAATQTKPHQTFSTEELEAWIPPDQGTQWSEEDSVTAQARALPTGRRRTYASMARPRDSYNVATERSDMLRSSPLLAAEQNQRLTKKAARAVSAFRQEQQEREAAQKRAARPASEPKVALASRMEARRHFVLSGTKERLAPLVGLQGLDRTKAATKLVSDLLQLPAEPPVHILDVHPVGRPLRPTDSPTKRVRLVFRVGSLAEADTLVRNRYRLKGTEVAIFDHLSPDELAAHRHLWATFIAARRRGLMAQFQRARLWVTKTLKDGSTVRREILPPP